MKPTKRRIPFAWLVVVAAALVLAVAVLAFSTDAKKETVSEPAAAAESSRPRALTDAPAADADAGRVGRPAAAAVAQWLRASNDKLAERAEDYQLDAPRKRNDLGETEPFREQAMQTAQIDALRQAVAGATIRLDFFPGVSREVTVTGRWDDPLESRLLASVVGAPVGDRFAMSWMAGQTRGLLELPSLNRAYEILRMADGTYLAREWLYTDVVCARPTDGGRKADAGIPPPAPAAGGATPGAAAAAVAVPVLNSRPSAVATIYLDFDGEVVTGTAWASGRTINALPARMTAAQIEETWRRVANHFAVFDVNVTTDRSVFDAAPGNRKTHCVITSTTDAMPGAGGVAYLNSFTNPSALYKICWTFEDRDPADAALISSHEIGHTLNLDHHGRVAAGSQPREEYYRGHGSGETGWGPFMGAPYGKNLLQWSKGEYARANNSSQDDLAVISTPARIPFLPDDHGDQLTAATTIQSGTAVTAQIQRNTDSDFFLVELDTGPQPVRVTLPQGTMLDAEIRIYDIGGRLLRTVNPVSTLAADTVVEFDVWEDIYIEIRGAGKAPVTGDGYSAYSSLGTYTLLAGTGTGTGPAVALSPLSLPGFRANVGSVSPSAPLLVRARRLTGPLTVRAPMHYEVSLDNTAFAPSVQPAPGSTVHVRLGDTAPAGVRRGAVEASSAGATPRALSVVGLVFGPPNGSMSFIQGALEKLHYFDLTEPPSAKFQNDYTLQFVDYFEHFDGLLRQGVPDRQARAETIMRMMGYRPLSGDFEHDSGYLPVGTAFGAWARLGLPPPGEAVQAFVRSARTLDERPVPVAVPAGGFNGLRGAPWGASYGMAAAFRDLFASRAFRDRHGDVRLMTSAAFYNWMGDTMFPGRAMGADGPAVLLDLLENGFAADYPTLAARRAMARGAAAAFRSVYATVLLTEARGANDGSDVEAAFQRRLHMAALRQQLWGDWVFHGTSPELTPARVAELLRVADITAPLSVAVPGDNRDLVFTIGVAGQTAPINADLRYTLSWPDGVALPEAAQVAVDGSVIVPARFLREGATSLLVRAETLAGTSTRQIALEWPGQQPAMGEGGLGAGWLASHNIEGCVQSAASDDGDAFCLVTEYAFGLDPNRVDTAAHAVRMSGEDITVEWRALKDGATYQVERSTDLREWSPVPGTARLHEHEEVGQYHRRRTLTLSRGATNEFFRIVANFDQPAGK